MSNFKPVIEHGKMLVCMRDEFGQDEAWYLSFDEIKIALGEAAQQSEKAEENEIIRLRELLWVGALCGACGHRYKYNRADDPNGEKGHKEHLIAHPDCPSIHR